MKTLAALLLGKITQLSAKFLAWGAGGTWPGEIALTLNPNFNSQMIGQLKEGIVIVAGTNGKTTTSLMLTKIIEMQGKKVVHNATGANLINGIASSFIQKSSWRGEIEADWGVFETDENSLPAVISNINSPNVGLIFSKKIVVILLNLFRDQLDRYGEVDVIAQKWEKALKSLPKETTIIANADDPLIVYIARRSKKHILYFGLNDKKEFLQKFEHATDSLFCPNCGSRLKYEGIYYSHIGIWYCNSCKEKRPTVNLSEWKSPLPGLYNRYNTLAAVLTAQLFGFSKEEIDSTLTNFRPAFGRQEEFEINGKKVLLFLSKNPAGFNQSLRTVIEMKAKQILMVLNDRIPDGKDVSWIWDVDFENILEERKIIVSGDRMHDLALRLKYCFRQWNNETKEQLLIEKNLPLAIQKSLEHTKVAETLYILPTYSAMLEVRKILTGRKIL
ncbi:MAG: Mur ligase family protein [Patescibacteria group bacterium]